MEQLLEQLKLDYDYILIDTPPIMPVTDAAVLSGKVDGLVMLVSSGEVTPAAAKEAKQRLLQAGAHILGVILNKVELAHTHGYGYYYYYGSDSTSGGTFVTRSEMEAAQVLKDISSIVKNSKDSCFRGMIGLGHLLLPLF